jgi:two-component system OmpR family response regulator
VRILLAEDDNFLASGLSMALQDSGYAVDRVATGLDAEMALGVTAYDLMILDLGLPKLDGTEVLRRMRSKGIAMPVIVLTARDSLSDRVQGLDLGANDYITKPFELAELEARIRALLRKEVWGNKMEISYGPIRFDTVSRSCTVNGAPLDLSPREMVMLEILLQGGGRIVSKSQINEHLSSWNVDLTNNAIDIAMHRLRKKFDGSGVNIRTIRGLGYLIENGAVQKQA